MIYQFYANYILSLLVKLSLQLHHVLRILGGTAQVLRSHLHHLLPLGRRLSRGIQLSQQEVFHAFLVFYEHFGLSDLLLEAAIGLEEEILMDGVFVLLVGIEVFLRGGLLVLLVALLEAREQFDSGLLGRVSGDVSGPVLTHSFIIIKL